MATGVAAVVLWTGPASGVETVVVADPPAPGVGPARGVALEQADEPTPVGFIAGYVGLSVLALGVAAVVRADRQASPRTAGPGLGIAYGRRATADFWGGPVAEGTGQERRPVPG